MNCSEQMLIRFSVQSKSKVVNSICWEAACPVGNRIFVQPNIKLGPVVHSIVSLTISLRGKLVKCFMTL